MALKFARLTRPAIRGLSAGERINEHGISAERMTNGDVRFSINIMVDGHRIHRVIGRESDGITREQAERAIEALRTRAREGRLDLPSGRKVQIGFAEASEDYLTRVEGHPKHGRNIDRKRQHIRARLTPHFKNLRLNEITEVAVSRYISSRKDQGAAPATINRELATLNHILARCIEWKWAKDKPRISKSPEIAKKIVVLNADEQVALMRAATSDQDVLTWLFVSIAIGTGMRHSEILRIRWEDVDTNLRRIHLPRAKAGARVQPVTPSLAYSLAHEYEKLGKPTGWLFPTERADAKHEHRQSMASQFRRTVVRANLDPTKITPHVLRHTAITGLVQAGVDLPTIQRISGHKTLAMVLRYTHLSDDHIDEALAKLDAPFSASIAPKLHTRIALLKRNTG